ncbi:MAG: ABC transporter ATP-binding protein [Lachnospiraceae bacterium]|nr:ABC transporter ATP-binding protein [Lachnospiraceae bacterium]
MAGPVIRVKNLYKIYRIGENRVRALNGVDFTIEKGEFCCIVGTSGSGKSTLLNMLAGLEKPTKGEIVIAGEHIEKKSESQLVVFRQAHVGFIFQSYNLLPNMTALENVALPLTFQGVDKKTRLKRAAAMLKMVGLAKYIKHKPGQMSGGQQQRVGIARALVVNPEIIFADEPTGNLDSNTSLEVMQLIQKIVRKRNQTLVMVTHDNYLAGFGDKVIHIRDGKILKIDDNRDHHQAVDPDGQKIEIEPPESVVQNMEAAWQPENAAQGAADMQAQGTIEEQAAVQALADIPAEETVS